MSKKNIISNKPLIKKPIGASKPSIATIKKANNDILHIILWCCICGFIAVIFIKQLKNEKGKAEIKGIDLSFSNFLSGIYQEYTETKLLAKPFMKELKTYKNDIEYQLFGKINLEGFYSGNDNYIFGEAMTKAYFGDDYFGNQAITDQVRKAKYVQSKLKDIGIELLILFAPCKSSIYTEYLPERILKTKRKPQNYESYVKACKLLNVNYIDFVQMFAELKQTSKYPLFSRGGSHWSYYSECIVVDTTIKKLEKLMNANLPNIIYSNIQVMDTSLVRDGDIFSKTQMAAPKGDLLAYPQSIGYEQGEGVVPQKILGIADSYFRCFFYLGAMQHAFNNSQQWYYYNSIIPENPNNPEVWELDLKAEILKNKAIVLLCNETNLKKLGSGFIDDAYEMFSNPQTYYKNKNNNDLLNKYKKEIRNNKELLAKMKKDSQQKGMSLDSLITETALKLQSENAVK